MRIQQVYEYDKTMPQPHIEEQPMTPKEETWNIYSHKSFRSSLPKEDAFKLRKDSKNCKMKQGFNTTTTPHQKKSHHSFSDQLVGFIWSECL